MTYTFDADVMDDLFAETVEGPACKGPACMRQGAGFELDEGADVFEEADGFEAMEDWAAEDEFLDFGEEEGMDVMDAMEAAVADALGAEDTDEFFRSIARGLRRVGGTVGRVARRVAPVAGRIARGIAPIASAIPLPWTQTIGRVANVVGRLMADEADKFEALGEMMDLAEDEDLFDAAAPVVAGLAIRSMIPNVARLAPATRRRLVSAVSRTTRTLARRQGPQAARAVPAIVAQARRAAVRRRLPPQALPQVVRQTAAQVVRSPRLARRLAAAAPVRARDVVVPGYGGAWRGSTSHILRGPVRITIKQVR